MTDRESDRSAIGGAGPHPVAVYVHVPFCRSKCAYCDFYSIAAGDEQMPEFVAASLIELARWAGHDLLRRVPSLYFGGGTPTCLGADLVRLVSGAVEGLDLESGAEVTVEANPESLHAALVDELVCVGVNRFSLGVQSFDEHVLRVLGRPHDAGQAQAAAEVLASTGLPFSLDLICGIPGQSYASWDDTLERAVATGARHVSVYPLGIEPGTPFAAAISQGRLPEPDPDVAAEMMLVAEVALTAAGLQRYEIASYAQPGYEARHNLAYWTGVPYLGVGPHAASMLPYERYAAVAAAEGWPGGSHVPADAFRVRFSRQIPLSEYLETPFAAPLELEVLSAPDALREDIMLGMRLRSGVAVETVIEAGLASVFESLGESDLVRLEPVRGQGPRWALTERGWLLGNRVFADIWDGHASEA